MAAAGIICIIDATLVVRLGIDLDRSWNFLSEKETKKVNFSPKLLEIRKKTPKRSSLGQSSLTYQFFFTPSLVWESF